MARTKKCTYLSGKRLPRKGVCGKTRKPVPQPLPPAPRRRRPGAVSLMRQLRLRRDDTPVTPRSVVRRYARETDCMGITSDAVEMLRIIGENKVARELAGARAIMLVVGGVTLKEWHLRLAAYVMGVGQQVYPSGPDPINADAGS